MSDSSPEETERDDFDASEETYEQGKPLWKKNGKLESYNLSTSDDKIRKPSGLTKWKDLPKFESKNSHSDDDLNALLRVF